MKDNFESDLIAPKRSPIPTKIAISIYWAISLLYLFFALDEIFTDQLIRSFISSPDTPVDGAHSAVLFLSAAWLAFVALKLFFVFKLSARKNWARIVVVIISTLLAAVFIYLYIYMGVILHRLALSVVLKSTYWPVAEVVAATLILLPKSQGWFVPKRTSV